MTITAWTRNDRRTTSGFCQKAARRQFRSGKFPLLPRPEGRVAAHRRVPERVPSAREPLGRSGRSSPALFQGQSGCNEAEAGGAAMLALNMRGCAAACDLCKAGDKILPPLPQNSYRSE